MTVLGRGTALSRGIDRGGVIDLDAAVRSIESAVAEAESMADCDIMGVTLAISGQHITALNESGTVPLSGLVTQEDIDSNTHGQLSDNTSVARFINKYKNMFGKGRIVVIKSQLGQPIAAYSGDKVYWKIPDNLPKMTKLMIDGKALYIHRANFQIIDTELLD